MAPVISKFRMSQEQIDLVCEIGRKTIADRIANAACDIILEGNMGKANVTLRSGPARRKVDGLTQAGFEVYWNLTQDIVAYIRMAYEDRSDVSSHAIRNMVFALLV